MYLLSQQFISNADFSVNNWRKPQLCSQQMRQKIPVSLAQKAKDVETQENVFSSLNVFSPAWRVSCSISS